MIIEEIKKQRQEEIKKGLNAWTYPPLYVVLDTREIVCEHSTSYSQGVSVFCYPSEYVRYSEEACSEIPAKNASEEDWDEPIIANGVEHGPVLKKSYCDRFITVCFTRKAAEEYIERNKHNLRKPGIYVFGAERRNIELIELCKLFGDNA